MTHPRAYLDQVELDGPTLPYRLVRLEVSQRLATITMAHPASRNAFSPRMTRELRHAIAAASEDANVAAIILTGSGGAFSAGGDLRQMEETALMPAEHYEFIRREFAGVVHAISSTDKPVIAAVDGPAMGVGFFAALSCDMVFASENARFGTAYIKLALTPLGISFVLTRVLGYVRTYEICALGEILSPAELLGAGLINRVTSPESLMESAREMGQRLAAGPARALAFTKQTLRRAAYRDLDEHLMLGEAVQPLCLASDDHREALRAFAEKRSPAFTGL